MVNQKMISNRLSLASITDDRILRHGVHRIRPILWRFVEFGDDSHTARDPWQD